MSKQGDCEIDRRHFLASAAVLGIPLLPAPPAWGDQPLPPPHPGFPRQELDRVRGVVGASHGNFDRVRELVTEQPALAKATWDWGFGDWETALGAASHTGRRQIAEFLIANGARPTLFSAAMLGEVDAVRAFLTGRPDLHLLHGPHGISLMRHARAGGSEAEVVLDYLESTFGPDEAPFGVEGTAAIEARYSGRFRFAEDPALEMSVGVRNGWLMFGAGAQPTSRVIAVEQDVFHPSGTPAVRFTFGVSDSRAESMTIEDGPVQILGTRVD